MYFATGQHQIKSFHVLRHICPLVFLPTVCLFLYDIEMSHRVTSAEDASCGDC